MPKVDRIGGVESVPDHDSASRDASEAMSNMPNLRCSGMMDQLSYRRMCVAVCVR